MDSLLRVMAAKKRELSVIQAEKQSKKEKYLRRAEVEELLYTTQEEEQKKAVVKEETTPVSKKRKLDKTERKEEQEEEVTLSWTDMKKRLRELGEPITLFGESTKARMERLRRAQHDAASRKEDELGEGHDIRNEFVERDEEGDDRVDEDGRGEHGEDVDAPDDDGKDDTDELLVYRFFKGMLLRWEQDLANRPDHIKHTAQGKMATKTMKQCKDYIRPLFKLCKKKLVPSDVLPNLVEIVRFCKQGEFVQANDAYIKLAIGNAAWPIGVTMVGIHERTGREKINANKQAHVMNNESQRKYITSVKRLISYAQSVSNVLPSKKVS
ncbi:hypothetical protein Poli38472_008388 [Pythium oligandrum]|uniref:Pre-mRNA-splicing factor 18 n=1 Tax=Pythium oligandrum TaxID=41045 RepID=A0A8K1FK77_PYTOL|nr:hypothetical protein Poli38472_008388 [Pythium oligandrum]|eukprot:TMW65746.1 hypothetical protein Poli38472_008388 [Pythium oligandrum]